MKIKYIFFLAILLFLTNCSHDLKSTHNEDVSLKVEPLYKIFNNKDTVISLSEGTKLFLKQNTFGNRKIIYLKSIEVYSISNIINNQLHTMSDSGLLETGGMLKIDFFDDSLLQKKLSPLKNLEIEFSFQDSLMSIFSLKKEEESEVWREEIIEKGYLTEDDILVNYSRKKNYKILTPEILKSWVNLDKYITERERVDLTVALNEASFDTDYYLIFKDINSVCKGGVGKNKIVFREVPLNMKAFILSLKNLSEFELSYSLTEILSSDSSIVLNSSLKSSPKQLNDLLNERFGERFSSI